MAERQPLAFPAHSLDIIQTETSEIVQNLWVLPYPLERMVEQVLSVYAPETGTWDNVSFGSN